MSLNALIENQVNQVTSEAIQQPVESAQSTLESLKQIEEQKLQANLSEAGVATSSPNVLNMVISGLMIGIPAYLGMGYLLDHLPFVLSQSSHTMVRLGAMFGMRPLINKLTKFTNDTFITPASSKLKNMANNKIVNPVQTQLNSQLQRTQNVKAIEVLKKGLQPQAQPV